LTAKFGDVFKTKSYQMHIRYVSELKHHLVKVWSDFCQVIVDEAINEWYRNLRRVSKKVAHHTLRNVFAQG